MFLNLEVLVQQGKGFKEIEPSALIRDDEDG